MIFGKTMYNIYDNLQHSYNFLLLCIQIGTRNYTMKIMFNRNAKYMATVQYLMKPNGYNKFKF